MVFAGLEDQLFSTYAPAMTKLSKRVALGDRAIPDWMAKLLIYRAQSRSQRLAATQRASVALMDEQLDESLAFADNAMHTASGRH